MNVSLQPQRRTIEIIPFNTIAMTLFFGLFHLKVSYTVHFLFHCICTRLFRTKWLYSSVLPLCVCSFRMLKFEVARSRYVSIIVCGYAKYCLQCDYTIKEVSCAKECSQKSSRQLAASFLFVSCRNRSMGNALVLYFVSVATTEQTTIQLRKFCICFGWVYMCVP